MSASIEVRITGDGRFQARRLDGLPLTEQDREDVKKLKAVTVDLPPRAWIIEEVRNAGKLQAVKICSAAIDAHLWLVLDESFMPDDDLAVYYPSELEWLRGKSIETLKKVHETKLNLLNGVVVQPQ